MARPQTASDDDIIKAATAVLARRGPDAFTLSDVAAEVGLSRAAIILRFKSAQALKLSLMTEMVDRFINALEHLPRTPSGDNLLAVADFIGGHVGSRQGSAKFFAQYSATVRDEGDEFAALTLRRGAALRAAITRVMPKTALAQDSAVAAFSAHLSGSILSWLALDHADAHEYVMHRSREWLRLAGIPFTKAADKPRAASSAKKPVRKRAQRS